MARRSLAFAVLVLAFGLLAQSALAVVPGGPRLAVSKLGPGFGGKIYTLGSDGSQRRTVLSGGGKKLPLPVGKVAWAPDGSQLAVAGMTALKPGKGGYSMQIFLVPADGGEPQPLAGTRGGSNPVFSPDGQTIAFAKQRVTLRLNERDELAYQSVSIWLLDLQTETSRRITPWRNRLVQIPSSFSPDGSVLAFTRYVADKRPEAIGINFDGSAASVLVTGSAIEPVFSPDGSRIAFLRGPTREVVRHRKHPGGGSSTTRWSARLADLYTVRYGGGELRRLTKTPKLDESEPSWDPSGQRLAYMEGSPLASQRAALGVRARLRAINADGSCGEELLHFPSAILYGPAWQPGPGRAAGPISC